MKCPECNSEFDFPRDKDISHSEFGQWIHDEIPRNFDWIDIDGVSRKSKTGIIRIVEEKRFGQELKGSQKRILSRLALGIEHLAKSGYAKYGSGVFVIYTEPPYNKSIIRQVYPIDKEESIILDIIEADDKSLSLIPMSVPKVFRKLSKKYPDLTEEDISFILANYFIEIEVTKQELISFVSSEEFNYRSR